MYHNYVNNNGVESLTIFINGELETISTDHANYNLLKNICLGIDESTDEEVSALIDAKRSVPTKLMQLSEYISLRNDELFYDEDMIDTFLSRHIIRLANESDRGLPAFVNFMEKLALNPSRLSRTHLFKWLESADFTITEEGDVIAYKSVEQDTLLSHHSGDNLVSVNGIENTGQVFNPVGGIIEMNRDEVDSERGRTCSYGLHVGTWSFASTFRYSNSSIVKVKIHPRDVVSVPHDASDQKMRVCKYEVLEIVDAPTNTALESKVPTFAELTDGPLFSDDEDFEVCDYCGTEGHDEDDCPDQEEDDRYDYDDDEF